MTALGFHGCGPCSLRHRPFLEPRPGVYKTLRRLGLREHTVGVLLMAAEGVAVRRLLLLDPAPR